MRRKSNRPPAYLLHKSTGQARVRINGKDHYLGKYGSDESRQRYLQLLAELAAGGIGKPGTGHDVDVATVVAGWLKHVETRYAASRERFNHRSVSIPLVRSYGATLAKDFGPMQLEGLQRLLASGEWLTPEERARLVKRKQPIGWCRNVINRQITRVKTMWRWAERNKLAPPGSWANLRVVECVSANDRTVRQTAKRRGVEWDVVAKALPFMIPVVQAMVQIQWWTGMRSEEVRTMRRREVDTSGEVWLYRPEHHKNDWREGDCGRIIPIGPECRKVIEPWVRRVNGQPDAYIFPPSRKRRQLLFTDTAYAQSVSRACQKAGVKWTPYQLRHAAKRRITRAIGADAARAILGHGSIDMTLQYDEGPDVLLAVEAAKKVG